jgi:hypothetical protein
MTLVPTRVTFRGLAHSDALEANIQERVAWLEQFHAGIVRCRGRWSRARITCAACAERSEQ